MIAVLDTETTTLGPEGRVIEVAVALLSPEGIDRVWSSLVRYEGPIDPAARAVHHIQDDELARAPEPGVVKALLTDILRSAEVFAAHHAIFDVQLLFQTWPDLVLPHQFICTYRCARHLYPDAPSHSNQVLRYFIPEVEAKTRGVVRPHRAGADAYITAHLLAHLLTLRTREELIALTGTPVLLTQVKFGKHAGMPWSDVPYDYLQWIVRQPDFDPDVVFTARHWMRQRMDRWTA